MLYIDNEMYRLAAPCSGMPVHAIFEESIFPRAAKVDRDQCQKAHGGGGYDKGEPLQNVRGA